MTTRGRYKHTEFSQFVKINLIFLSFRDHDETVAQLNSMSDEQIRQPAVTSGAYDIIAIIPAGDKRYESAENPASSRPSHQLSTAAASTPDTKKDVPYSPSCSTKTAASSKNSRRFLPLTHPRDGILYCGAVEAPNKSRASAIRRGCSGCNSHPTAHSIFPTPPHGEHSGRPHIGALPTSIYR